MTRCVYCAEPLFNDEVVCPHCGGEQPVRWLTDLVYALAFLFVQGAVYRMIWPNSTSLVRYGIYFILTVAAAIPAWWIWNRLRPGPSSDQSDQRKSDIG